MEGEKASIIQSEETNVYLGKQDLSYTTLKDEQDTILAYPSKDPNTISFYHWDTIGHKWERLGTYNLKTKEYQEDQNYAGSDWYYSCIQRHIAYLEEVIKRATEV